MSAAVPKIAAIAHFRVRRSVARAAAKETETREASCQHRKQRLMDRGNLRLPRT